MGMKLQLDDIAKAASYSQFMHALIIFGMIHDYK